MGGAYRSEGGGWLDRFREWSGREAFQYQLPSESESLDAAHDAGPLDAATIFAYFDGRLTAEERAAVEAEAAASPVALRKLTRLGALAVRGTSPTAGSSRPARPASAMPSVRVCLSVPQDVDTPQAALDRPELAQRADSDPDLEVRRFRCQGIDLVRADHATWPVGTLLRTEWAGQSTTFAVMRPASQSGTAACFAVPPALAGRPITADFQPVSAFDLTEADAEPLGRAFQDAGQTDPRSRSTFDAPVSAWETCAERLLEDGRDDAYPTDVAPAILEFAEAVLRDRRH